MKTTLEICLFLLLIGLPIYLFYWRLFRPILIVRLRYRIFKARDDLRLLALSGEMDKKDRAYPILDTLLQPLHNHIGGYRHFGFVYRPPGQTNDFGSRKRPSNY